MTEETFNYDGLFYNIHPLNTERVLIAAGQNLVRGTVLGRVTQSTPTTGTADAGNTGNGTVTAVTGGKDTKIGTYKVTCVVAVTNGGTFNITDPNDKFVGQVTITAGAGGTGVFKSDELNLTITDGSTDFVVGDLFTIAVSSGVPIVGTADGGNTGNGTMTLVVGNRDLKVGVYTMICTAVAANGGTFSVEDPDGIALPDATVGTLYENDQISFKINDGSTDFILADEFTVTVTIGKDQVKVVNSANTDGSSAPRYVLLEDTDASSAAKKAPVARTGSFNERKLVFGGTDTIETHRDAMRDVGLLTNASVANTEPQ